MAKETVKALDPNVADFDVVAVDLQTNQVRLLAQRKTEKKAKAIVEMAVMRRGVDKEFFAIVPTNEYREGTQWQIKD